MKLLSQSGVVVWSATYDAFGKATVNPSSTLTNNLRLPGQYYDAETRLHYNWMRHYDPGTGRYVTSDPIGLEGGINMYAYVGENPLRWVDPYGLRDVIVAVWTSNVLQNFTGEVGHVFVGEMNGTTITSQFLTPSGYKGENTTKTWIDTVAYEGRSPDYVYQVTVPDDKAFDEVAAKARSVPTWFALPNGKTSTNCSTAAQGAIRAGGVRGLPPHGQHGPTG